MNKKEMMLYIHIPFCVRKCNYCDFLSFGQDSLGAKAENVQDIYKKYVNALIRNIEQSSEQYSDYLVTSIFIGGGTPSILDTEIIDKLLKSIRSSFSISHDVEYTIESNPGTLTREKLECYKENGINRLSIGLQSANDDELKLLGRIHSYHEFEDNYFLARKCGFDNINIDLISAIPNQTIESFTRSLNKVIELKPEHISCYSLIIEEGTPFYEWDEKRLNLPAEDDERLIYYKARNILKDNGYNQYEISNFALINRECRHNIGYWERRGYLGLGLGASSFVDNERWKMTNNLRAYIENDFNKTELETLTKDDCMSEFMFLGLRKTKGVSEIEFEKEFGTPIDNVFGEWNSKMVREELLTVEDKYYRLTNKGMDLANYVMSGYV